MADGEGSSNEGNSQPATGGALVNKIGALTFDAGENNIFFKFCYTYCCTANEAVVHISYTGNS